MKLKTKIKFYLIISGILSLSLGCETPVIENTDTPTPTLTQETTSSSDLLVIQVQTATQTPLQLRTETSSPTSPPATNTPTLTNTTVSQTAQPQIPALDFCRESESDICIGSFSPISGKLAMVFLKPNNQEKCFILFDNEEFACTAVTGVSDRYFCSGLPAKYNQSVSIQIFLVGSSTPLAAGEIFIPSASSPPPTQPTATKVPKPPDPYDP